MRIRKLVLENFIGLSKLDNNRFELNFYEKGETSNRLILFKGDNGSGKTTAMSHAQPFPHSNDGRGNPIIEGEDGYKQVIIDNDENEYDCRIYYKKGKRGTTKCYVSKNGIELNEPGHVKSYYSILEQELGLTKDYFKLGAIGSTVDNFITLSKAERKTYISKLLPDISKYMKAFTIVSSRYKVLKSKIDMYTNMLNDIPDNDTILEHIDTIEGSIKTYSENRDSIVTKLSKLNDSYKSVDSKLNDIKLNKPEVLKVPKDIDMRMGILNEDLDNLNDIIGDINRETCVANIDSVTKNGKIIKKQLELLNIQLIDYNDKMDSTKAKISELNGEDSDIDQRIVEIEKEISSIKSDIDYDSELTQSLLQYTDNLNELINVFKYIKKILKFKNNNLSHGLGIYDDKTVDKHIKNIEDSINEVVKTIEKRNKRYSEIDSNFGNIELLDSRPTDCVIDTCPFIKNAIHVIDKYDLKNGKTELEEIKEKLIDDKNSLDELNKELLSLKTIKFNINNFNQLIEDLSNSDSDIVSFVLNILNIEKENIIKISSLDINNITVFIDDVLAKTNYIKTYVKLSNKLDSLIIIKNKNSDNTELLNHLNTTLVEYKTQHKNIKTSINSYNLNINELRSELIKYKNVLSNLDKRDELIISKDKYIDIKETFDLYKLLKDEYNSIKNDIYTFETELNNINNKLHSLNSKLTKYKIMLDKKNSYTDTKNELEKNYTKIKIVKDSLDIKKGIPLVYTRSYLESIRVNINKLLDIVYDGMVIDFNVTEKEFDIVLRNAELNRSFDILSDGEKAIIKLTVSMGMLAEIIKKNKYKIMYLDEVDATLDSGKRRIFLDILNAQCDLLGIDQVFIISHNDALDNINSDIVLLSNRPDEYVINGKILYSV